MTAHEQTACSLFRQGYNCAQAVVGAFCDEIGMTQSAALRLASAFGGGMGRMREVCGAVSGMYMVLGILYGYDDAADNCAKKELYSHVQSLAEEFKAEYKTIVCRELLGVDGAQKPEPTPRNAEFYKARPCLAFVGSAARILEKFINEHPYR